MNIDNFNARSNKIWVKNIIVSYQKGKVSSGIPLAFLPPKTRATISLRMQENHVCADYSQPLLVSVRSLVEFVLQSGDLTPGGFQRRDRAQLGTQGHKRVQRSRPEGYETEVEITCAVSGDPPLEVRGRLDGVYISNGAVIIEEIKTTTLSLALIEERDHPLHWAQAKCYAYMYGQQHSLEQISIHLTYYHIDTHEEKSFERHFSLTDLQTFFHTLTTAYQDWLKRLHAWLSGRNESIDRLEFPYPAYRPGQREMAVAVYKAIRDRERLYVQAPTGVGKTIATLFPAVKALGKGLADRIFYLTAKTPGRLAAEKSLEDMRQAGLQIRSVTLTAKEKICFCPPADCDPERCEFARDYFGKVKNALLEMDHHQAFTRPVIESLARQYQICPFEFSLDLALWMDCIICDYNYAFDPRVYLHRFFDLVTEPYLFLVDEAHNLPDRARSMYSAELEKKTVLNLKRSLKTHLPGLAKRLNTINKILLEIRKTCQAAERTALVESEPPEALLGAVREFCLEAETWLVMNQPADFRQELLEFYFLCMNYLRTAEYFDTYYVSYFERQRQGNLKAKLFCLDPAPMLAGPLERSQATLFFSATLLPMDYFKQLLTGAADHHARVFSSPFPQENFSLLIYNTISTRYAKRADSYEAIATAIETVCTSRGGNYLVYFPSYAYLAAVHELLKERLPEDRLLVQGRGMAEAERDDFLARFSGGNPESLVGLAVMGGIFGEGIDLVGDRLIGAVIVGAGVPQVCLENDLIKDYFSQQGLNGFAYAYQYPGFNRVLQATGRVIRSETDRGVIVLIDDRFTQPRYRRLFPRHWQGFQAVQDVDEIEEKLAKFWAEE